MKREHNFCNYQRFWSKLKLLFPKVSKSIQGHPEALTVWLQIPAMFREPTRGHSLRPGFRSSQSERGGSASRGAQAVSLAEFDDLLPSLMPCPSTRALGPGGFLKARGWAFCALGRLGQERNDRTRTCVRGVGVLGPVPKAAKVTYHCCAQEFEW